MEDVFAIQDEITGAIVGELRPKLLGEEKVRIATRQTVDIEAYNLYLQGCYFWEKRTEEGLKKAIEYFERAIGKEPNYALAYVGIADSHILYSYYTLPRPEEVYPKAKEAVSKALDIDEDLGEAHATLAFIMTTYDFDRNGAEQEFSRALELNPGYANAHHWYGAHLSNLGRSDDAIRELEIALELDPLSVVFRRTLGFALIHARKYDQAIDVFRKALELDPQLMWGHLHLGQCYLHMSMYSEALAEYEAGMVSSPDLRSSEEANIGIAYAKLGREEEARQILKDLLIRAKKVRVSYVHLAQLCFVLGEYDQGFEVLEKGYADRDFLFGLGKSDPLFDTVRSDPRFQELLKKVGLDK
jgi:tetratricopeptide (TPR) repeat protein